MNIIKREDATRIHTACLWLEGIAKEESTKKSLSIRQGVGGLRRAVVDKIKAYEATHLKRGDLMAVRNRPAMFHREPYNFLWVLHRYQNHRPMTREDRTAGV
jgi:hypothetical protein